MEQPDRDLLRLETASSAKDLRYDLAKKSCRRSLAKPRKPELL
ncbi:hypothetical protein [Pseudenhygromyxa sp. WMMC2535]|nr:hypothetical protein [Pseudenhygromyxa sp. WMMC2535]